MIRALGEADAHRYVELRRRALLDAPLSFAASPEDDVAASVEAVRAQLQRPDDGVVLALWSPS